METDEQEKVSMWLSKNNESSEVLPADTGPDLQHRQLYGAILSQAVHDLVRRANPCFVNEAISWFTGSMYDEPPVSFQDCCDVLKMSPEGILGELRARGLLQPMIKPPRKNAAQTLSDPILGVPDQPAQISLFA